MPQFRKRPVIIEAEQWFPGKGVEVPGSGTGLGRIHERGSR